MGSSPAAPTRKMKLKPITLKNKLLIFACLFFYLLGFIFGGWSIIFNLILISLILNLIKKSFDKGVLLNSYLIIILVFLILNNLIKIGYFLNLINKYQVKKENQTIPTISINSNKVSKLPSPSPGWKRYIDDKGDYYLDLPNYFVWNRQEENSVLFEKNLTQKPHRTNNYIQITKKYSLKNTEEKINKLKEMSIGEKKVIQFNLSINNEISKFYTYERLPNDYINDYQAIIFINKKPFEAREGDNYYIFLIDDYIIEAITNENNDSLDNISYDEFYKIISSFRIIKTPTQTVKKTAFNCPILKNKTQQDIDYENAEKNLSSYSYKEYLPNINSNEKPLEKIITVNFLEKKLLPCKKYDENYCQISNKNLWVIKYPKEWQLFRIKKEINSNNYSLIFYDLKFEYKDSYFYLKEIGTLGGQPIIIKNNQWKDYLQNYCDKPFFTDKNKTNYYICDGGVLDCAAYINNNYDVGKIKKYLKSFVSENSSIQKEETLIYDFYIPSINFEREENPGIRLAYVLSSDFYSNDENFISELTKIYSSLIPSSK